jgi:hypothetical protein
MEGPGTENVLHTEKKIYGSVKQVENDIAENVLQTELQLFRCFKKLC